MSDQWEYYRERFTMPPDALYSKEAEDDYEKAYVVRLNELGAHGWEIVAVDQYLTTIFKRKIHTA
jgi:hypothetical protein